MTTTHKKITLLVVIILIAFWANAVPQQGKTITMNDKLQTNPGVASLSSLESQAAAVPTLQTSDKEITIGIDREQFGGSKDEDALIVGALSASTNAFTSPFIQRAEIYPPEIQAGIAFIGDLNSGMHYLEKGIDRHWPIASITKLMTAVVASKVLSPETIITMSPENFPGEEGSSTRSLKTGDEFMVRDLIKIMLIVSDNAAAEALAQSYGRADFLSKMNSQAKIWGMTQTYFYDPSGLSPVNQSSVADLEKLAFQLMNHHQDILGITQGSGVRVLEQKSKRERSILPINVFAGRSDFIGGKTGFINEAGGNLLSIFSVKKRPVLVVVLNSSNRFDDTSTLLDWFKQNYE